MNWERFPDADAAIKREGFRMCKILMRFACGLVCLAVAMMVMAVISVPSDWLRADEPTVGEIVMCGGAGDLICAQFSGDCEEPPRQICTDDRRCWCAYEGDPQLGNCKCKKKP